MDFADWPPALDCPYGPFHAIVASVHDGDTLTVLCDLGFAVRAEVVVRVYGIQAPELLRGSASDRAAGAAAAEYLKGLLPVGTRVRITTLIATNGEQTMTFVRYVASVEYLPDALGARDIAAEMVRAGHAFWCDRDLRPLKGPPPPIAHWVEAARGIHR